MFTQLMISIRTLIVLTILTGVIYPLLVTAGAQTLFAHQANGSLILLEGRPVGSELIGQSFDDPRYFWGRLSATSPAYNAAASSGTNYGPLHPALRQAASDRIQALRAAGPHADRIPVDLVTASASGLDPHISLAAAYYQSPRIAAARGLTRQQVDQLIQSRIEGRWLGILGEPVVNVLRLNLVLDALQRGQQLDHDAYSRSEGLPRFMKWGNLDGSHA